MLDAVIRSSLRHRPLVVVAALAVLVYGAWLGGELPVDVFPDLDRPRVVLITECPGLATEEVELLVAGPLEIALLGASGVRDVRSQTTAGLNVIYVEFDWSADVRAARQAVQERLAALGDVLPQGVRPQMTPPSSIMGQIVIAGLYRQRGPSGGVLAPAGRPDRMAERIDRSEGPPEVRLWQVVERRDPSTWKPLPIGTVVWRPSIRSDPDSVRAVLTLDEGPVDVEFLSDLREGMELRTTADWLVRPRLRKLSGVAEVFVQGGDRKQYQVLVEPEALLEYGVSLQQVERALADSNLNTSGGFAVQGETERPIRIIGRLGPDAPQVIEQLRSIPVKPHPVRPVLLEQVARVEAGPQPKRGDGAVDGRPGVVFTIAKQPHVDTRDLTRRIVETLDDVEASLPADVVINSELFQLRRFIDRGIFNVGEALVVGALLVLVILFLFLLNFRTTFITLTAIPLSLAVTTIVFHAIGVLTGTPLSINVMTLGGVAVAMGELVDDAIVDVENIFRRLKENHALGSPRTALVVVYDASREIRSAIVFGTAVVILVFLPLFALSGVEGRLFAPLGVAYIVSILASLFVSLTVTPVLSYYLLPKAKATHRASDGRLLQGLKRLASGLIRTSIAAPAPLLAASWLLTAFAAWQFAQLGRNFLPQFDEGSVQINLSLPPGSSLEATNRVAAVVDAKLNAMRKSAESPAGAILTFVRRTGRAELDEHALPVSSSEYILSMNPASGRRRDDVLAELLDELSDELPGVDVEVEQPLAHLISHMVSGVYAQIAVKVHGDDLDTLLAVAGRIKAALDDVPGLTPPVVEPIRQAEELHIRLRPDDLARYGLTRAYVADVMQTALQGKVASQVLEGQRRFDLLVRLEEHHRSDFAQLGRLRIDFPDSSGQVELRRIADIEDGVGPNAVNRENGRRRIVVRCNTQGRDLASAVEEVQRTIRSQVDLPEGYFVEYGGQFESQRRATALIGALAGLSVVGMFAVLLMLYPSVRIVLQILNALPTAFTGGVFALVLTGQSLTVAALVGFISLGGIAVRNGILLVTHYFHLMREEGEPFSAAMVVRGSLERLAPVLMTALTAGIGLAPLVYGGDQPGREILYPVATVILGGLFTSTFCEFLLHPGLFWRFSGRDAERLARRSDAVDELMK